MAHGKKLPVGWFPQDIIQGPKFCLCLSQEAFDAAITDLNIPDYRAGYLTEGATAVTYNFEDQKKNASIVCMPPMLEQDLVFIFTTLLHEAVHVWQYFMHWIQEDSPGMELEAYGIDRITTKLINEYLKQTGRSFS